MQSEEYRKGYSNGYTAGYRKGMKAPKSVDLSKIPPFEKTCFNENEDYDDVDQFVCSKCGIHLQGWYRVDEDDFDDGIVHEYTLRFCPNCGAKVADRKDEPQTEDEILREQCRAFMGIVEQTEGSDGEDS